MWQWGLHYAQDVLWNPQRSPRGKMVEIPGLPGERPRATGKGTAFLALDPTLAAVHKGYIQ